MKTPIKQRRRPIIFIKLNFSLKNKHDIRIINIGDEVYIIPILTTVVVWPAINGNAPQIPHPVAPKMKSLKYSFLLFIFIKSFLKAE